ncbi:MAG TPA: hypothetical protein VF602_00450 [Pedobacter sp.]|jgi:hypothetical protein
MKIPKVLTSAITATSAMTAFSYLVSYIKERNFREPELLADLSQELIPNKERALALPTGWLTHYSMGLAWALFETCLVENRKMKADVKSSVLFGCFGGVTGALVWGLVFKIHPKPPQIPYRRFYGHLILAHIVYSIALVQSSKNLALLHHLSDGPDTHSFAFSNSSSG